MCAAWRPWRNRPQKGHDNSSLDSQANDAEATEEWLDEPIPYALPTEADEIISATEFCDDEKGIVAHASVGDVITMRELVAKMSDDEIRGMIGADTYRNRRNGDG